MCMCNIILYCICICIVRLIVFCNENASWGIKGKCNLYSKRNHENENDKSQNRIAKMQNNIHMHSYKVNTHIRTYMYFNLFKLGVE